MHIIFKSRKFTIIIIWIIVRRRRSNSATCCFFLRFSNVFVFESKVKLFKYLFINLSMEAVVLVSVSNNFIILVTRVTWKGIEKWKLVQWWIAIMLILRNPRYAKYSETSLFWMSLHNLFRIFHQENSNPRDRVNIIYNIHNEILW